MAGSGVADAAPRGTRYRSVRGRPMASLSVALETGTVSQEQSALIVALPEAEQDVAQYREVLDSGAVLGVPAHVTILYPFMPAELVTDNVASDLSRLFLTVSPFDVTFGSIG